MAPLDDSLPSDFDGTCRLFPLPNLVLFPHLAQPLRIFEPRYREMLSDALAGDRLIAIVKLKPNWETSYDKRPAMEVVGCVGRIAAHAQQLKGESNILLTGLRRIRIVRELDVERSYRVAQVEVLEDRYSADEAQARRDAHRAFLRRFRRLLPPDDAANEQVAEMFNGETPLGRLTDLIAVSANLEIEFLQELLEELVVERRAQRLLERLEQEEPPPASLFSNN